MAPAPSPFFYGPPSAYSSAAAYPPPAYGFSPAPPFGYPNFPSAAAYAPYSPPPAFPSAATYPYPSPASAYTPTSGSSPNRPAWPPPAPLSYFSTPVFTAATSPTAVPPAPTREQPQPLSCHTPVLPSPPSTSSDPSPLIPGADLSSSGSHPSAPPPPLLHPVILGLRSGLRAPGSTPSSTQPWVASSPSPELDSRRIFITTTASVSKMQPAPVPLLEPFDTFHTSTTRKKDVAVLSHSRLDSAPEVFGNTPTSHPGADESIATAQARVVQAEAQAQAEVLVSKNLPRAVLDLKRRLDEHEAQTKRSFVSLQGQLSKLTDMFSSLTNSMVLSSTSSTTTAPTPSSGSTTMAASAPSLFCVAASSPRTKVRADGSEHSYFALPGNYTLEQDMHEPLLSTKFVGVSDSNPEQQPCEEEQQECEQPLKCLSKKIETEHTSACVSIISEVLELQPQDDGKSRNCPALKTSDPYVTRSSQFSIVCSVTEIRLLWDPGDTTSYALFTTADSATNLQCTNVYKTAVVQILAVQFGVRRVPIFKSATMRSAAFGLKWTEVNASFLFVLVVQSSAGTSVDNPFLFLSNDVNSRTNHSFPKLFMYSVCTTTVGQVTIQRQTLAFCLMDLMSHKGSEFRNGQLTCMPTSPMINSSEVLRQRLNVLSSWFPSFEMDKLQWDPGILNTMYMLLDKYTVPNLMDLKHFWAPLLLQYHSWCTIRNALLQDQYCCLPTVLDCLYSEPVKQLACYSSMFSSTEAIHSARSMSTATVRMLLALSSGKIAQEGRDAAAVHKVSKIQLPMRKTSHVWDPGIESILVFYKWLHIQIIQLVHCSAIHAGYFLPAHLPPTQITAYCPSNVGFVHQQRVKKSYNAKNLLSSPNYLQILILDILFITFLPP